MISKCKSFHNFYFVRLDPFISLYFLLSRKPLNRGLERLNSLSRIYQSSSFNPHIKLTLSTHRFVILSKLINGGNGNARENIVYEFYS